MTSQNNNNHPSHTEAFPTMFLWLGILVGSLGFLGSLLWDNVASSLATFDQAMPVATVNGVAIDRDGYINQVRALADDKRNPLTNLDADFVLQRIIEEELLVQRGLEVLLPQTDRQTRGTIVSAMISMVTADANSYQPSERELRTYYEENSGYFQKTERLRVRKLDVSGADAEASASALEQAVLGGESLESLLDTHITIDRYLPDALLPPLKLREYIGPTPTLAMMNAQVGYTQMVVKNAQQASVYYLAEKEAGELRPFPEVRELVESEFIRTRSDTALRDYLEWLKKRAEIEVFSNVQVNG
ncbi:peptidylprolyl isomerase [Kistimonas asteriae]|uniref:peptidylprolyl isomerase n=1 Tax=Kistimonas asteriae TaxID=517724 RepID=UPI001BA85E88|nr:peptidylprolyl isomerase [Kistimonas asteriae]